jgi:hypothetical protein
MDQGSLKQIRTFSQSFSDNPNEKFLLMILCSQAKLENDQKGINVKRGIRAKCEMGWRPGKPPIGYYNRAFSGVKDIMVDPERGPIVAQMFERVAVNGDSGRTLKKWLDTCLTTRSGKKLTLSLIYLMLKNPFYYGEFEYPAGIGRWYKGAHDPLIAKETFDKVQRQLLVPFEKAKWGSKVFTFKGLFECASCGSSIVGEEKWRKRRNKQPRHHIYYHCSRQKDYNCTEPYLSEERLAQELLKYIETTVKARPRAVTYSDKLKNYMEAYQKTREIVLLERDISPGYDLPTLPEYSRYALKNGSMQEKREIMGALGGPIYLHDRALCPMPKKPTGAEVFEELISVGQELNCAQQ